MSHRPNRPPSVKDEHRRRGLHPLSPARKMLEITQPISPQHSSQHERDEDEHTPKHSNQQQRCEDEYTPMRVPEQLQQQPPRRSYLPRSPGSGAHGNKTKGAFSFWAEERPNRRVERAGGNANTAIAAHAMRIDSGNSHSARFSPELKPEFMYTWHQETPEKLERINRRRLELLGEDISKNRELIREWTALLNVRADLQMNGARNPLNYVQPLTRRNLANDFASTAASDGSNSDSIRGSYSNSSIKASASCSSFYASDASVAESDSHSRSGLSSESEHTDGSASRRSSGAAMGWADLTAPPPPSPSRTQPSKWAQVMDPGNFFNLARSMPKKMSKLVYAVVPKVAPCKCATCTANPNPNRPFACKESAKQPAQTKLDKARPWSGMLSWNDTQKPRVARQQSTVPTSQAFSQSFYSPLRPTRVSSAVRRSPSRPAGKALRLPQRQEQMEKKRPGATSPQTGQSQPRSPTRVKLFSSPHRSTIRSSRVELFPSSTDSHSSSARPHDQTPFALQNKHVNPNPTEHPPPTQACNTSTAASNSSAFSYFDGSSSVCLSSLTSSTGSNASCLPFERSSSPSPSTASNATAFSYFDSPKLGSDHGSSSSTSQNAAGVTAGANSPEPNPLVAPTQPVSHLRTKATPTQFEPDTRALPRPPSPPVKSISNTASLSDASSPGSPAQDLSSSSRVVIVYCPCTIDLDGLTVIKVDTNNRVPISLGDQIVAVDGEYVSTREEVLAHIGTGTGMRTLRIITSGYDFDDV